jgi:hypothetical protein
MTPLPPLLPTPRFDVFYRHPEQTQLLQAYAHARPDLVKLHSIGKSFEGRDIWLLSITNTHTGPDSDKPAFWVDGNIHAAELTACTACLYYIDQLVSQYGVDAQITHLLDTRVVYICPRLNPDGAELALADKPRHIRSSTRRYPFEEEPVEGLTIEDVNGDGRVLFMRIPDPHGAYKKHSGDARLMVPRDPGEFGGDYFRLMPEGSIQQYNGLTVNVNPDAEGLDLNRNFPTGWRQEHEQVGAGPYPTSEPEVRAMVDFITSHPNIGAAISYHTHSGVILRPMGSQSDDDMIPEDLWSYKRFSALGTASSGYPAISIWHEFKYHHRNTRLDLRTFGRAVLDGRAVGTQQRSRHHRLQMDRLVPRPPGRRRPQVAEVERRPLWWPRLCRLEAVSPSAVGRNRNWRLGQDELLAQPAAAFARA